jgi:hypothetical protein
MKQQIMNETRVGACPDGGDSPLSWAGNLAGLLTFALGIFVTLVALLAATRDAEEEIKSLQRRLKLLKDHITWIGEYVADMNVQADPRWDDIRPAVNTLEGQSREVDDYLAKHFSNPSLLWTRIKWWYRERETTTMFAKLESCSGRLVSAQLINLQG